MELKELKQRVEDEKMEALSEDRIMLMSEVAKIKSEKYKYERYQTGIFPFDDAVRLNKEQKGGLTGGDLVIIAAPTGNGKTTLASTISFQMMRENGTPSLWFSYEVNTYHLWENFKEMGAKPDEFFCVPLENSSGSLEWIEKKIIEAKRNYWAKIIVIDHLGFLAPNQKMNGNMTQNYSSYLGQIVRELKTLAVKEDIIIILPVHMVKSASPEPTLRDIGNSAGIAQEADVVILMAREENTEKSQANSDYYTQYTKVILAKNRPGGVTPTWWMEKANGRLVEANKIIQKHDTKERAI